MSELRLAIVTETTPIAGAGDHPEQHQPAPHTPGGQAIWVFILGDMSMFAAFFGQFLYDRAGNMALFADSQHAMNIAFGAINTLILLTGSLFVVFGVEAVKGKARARVATTCFALAFVCAAAFGVNKVLEYSAKLSEGITPATNLFFSYYYMYTGIHAAHLLIGMVFLARMWQLARQDQCSAADIRFIEVGASYWHLVDLLWVVLFALLYLLN